MFLNFFLVPEDAKRGKRNPDVKINRYYVRTNVDGTYLRSANETKFSYSMDSLRKVFEDESLRRSRVIIDKNH